jgi:HD-GYP domain-containing protein (c-di-GMP phosphodiesterase class II)
MAQQANFVQEGVDRLREAVSSIEGDLERMQDRVQEEFSTRRKSIEKQVSSSRKNFEKKTQKQVKRLRSELRKNTYVKRAQGVVDDATKQFEQGVDNVLEVLHVASKRDLSRIDRKLNQINRKLRDLEKAKQGNGAATAD